MKAIAIAFWLQRLEGEQKKEGERKTEVGSADFQHEDAFRQAAAFGRESGRWSSGYDAALSARVSPHAGEYKAEIASSIGHDGKATGKNHLSGESCPAHSLKAECVFI